MDAIDRADKALLLFMDGEYDRFITYLLNDVDQREIRREMILLMAVAYEKSGRKKESKDTVEFLRKYILWKD